MGTELVDKFDHLLQIGYVISIFSGFDSGPHSSKSHSIQSYLFVGLYIYIIERKVNIELIGFGEVWWHLDYHTTSFDEQLTVKLID